MARPTLHSYTWSDHETEKTGRHRGKKVHREAPNALEGKELHLWVTYPDNRVRKPKKNARRVKSKQKDLRLWAVLVVEALENTEPFTFEVTLRRVFKSGESMIKVWVRNDPRDQSDEAAVFGFVSPPSKELTVLEQRLAHVAAKRVYDAILQTWPDPPSPVNPPGRVMSNAEERTDTNFLILE